MNKEEYIKYMTNNKEANAQLEINSAICAILEILTSKNICNGEELEKAKEKHKKEILENAYKKEKKEDLEKVKQINDFLNMFNINGDE